MEFLLKNKKWFIIGLSALMAVCLSVAVIVGVLSAGGKELPYQGVTYNVSQHETDYSSPSNISINSGNIFVSDETKGTVTKLGTTAVFQAGDQVNGVYAFGGNVYALVGGLEGYVVKLDNNLKEVARAETGHTPVDAVIVNGKLYVANRFSNTVTVYDANMKLVKTINVSREPMAMTVSGSDIYVACHLPAGAANAEKVSADVSVISTATDALTSNISLLNGTSSVKDICVSSDGDYLYVTNIFSRYTYPTTQLDRGWINTNGVTVIALKEDSAVGEEKYDMAGVLLDQVNLGAPNPYGVACSDGKMIVTLSGTEEIVVMDEAIMLSKLNAAKRSGTLEDAVNSVTLFAEARQRFPLYTETAGEVKGSRYIAIDGEGDYAYVGNYFSGNVSKVDLTDYSSTQIKVADSKPVDEVRAGEILWYDATECYQKWESCASCHPDARVDAFNWDNLNDGLGNAKQTKSMIYSHRTPPVMVTGARDSAELAVLKGMNFIQFNTMDEVRLNYINDFLKSIKPMESPYLNRDGSLSDSAKRGKKLFEQNSCTTCHYGPNFTDTQFHTSKTLDLDDTWESRDFVTPTLVEVWRSAPYFFNGSMATMEEAVKFYLPNAPAKDITDIANYVLSIGDSNEPYGVEQVFFTKGKDTVINKLMPNQNMGTVTVRKQAEYDGDVIVKISYCDAKGNMIKEGKKAQLRNLKVGDLATINLGVFEVPAEMSEGGYYKISITNAKGKNITTDYKVYIKEA